MKFSSIQGLKFAHPENALVAIMMHARLRTRESSLESGRILAIATGGVLGELPRGAFDGLHLALRARRAGAQGNVCIFSILLGRGNSS